MTVEQYGNELLVKFSKIHYHKLTKGRLLPVSMHNDQVVKCSIECCKEILLHLDTLDSQREFIYSTIHYLESL
jgi:predicted flavoprotein YhiN